MKYIDLRSDTVTEPTVEMRQAMSNAEVGDDVYGDDPTVNELEALAADIVKKEAALFVPSGTFGNQLAVMTHTRRGDEIILGEDCHIAMHECGASAVISGVQLATVHSAKGGLPVERIRRKIRDISDIHVPRTGLICMEYAYGNGMVAPLDELKSVYDLASENSVPVHMDGARLFNAAEYLKVEPASITKYCDSVMFCISKGLCAPVGSLLAGKKEFIDQARRGRKLLGGGMRQAGILAAAGLIALNKMRFRLKEDHENARYLVSRLQEVKGVSLNPEEVHINMVFFSLENKAIHELDRLLLDKGIRINPPEGGEFRLVTHYWITRKEIDILIDEMKKICG